MTIKLNLILDYVIEFTITREIAKRKLTLYKVINFLVNTVDFEGNHGSH